MWRRRKLGRGVAAAGALLAVGLVLAWGQAARALDPALDVSQYAHTAWKVREGFSKGSITTIAQTPDGYLWLGTDFGLLRFDGVRNVPWEPPAGVHLPSTYVRSLVAARDGTLWIGTDKGLASWKGGKLTPYPELDGKAVDALLEDREGTLWVGLFTFSGGRLCAIRGGKAQCYGGDGSLAYAVFSLYEDSKGNLWAGTLTGVWRWKPGPPKFYPTRDAPNGVQALTESDNGALLVAAGSRIAQIVDGKVEAYPLPAIGRQVAPIRLLRDRDGSLWIGTTGGELLHIHGGKTDVFAQSDGLSGEYVVSLFEDREGNIWVATDNGLERFHAVAVPTISVQQGLSSSRVWSMLAAADGTVWLNSHDGLNLWKDGQIATYRKRRAPTVSGGEKREQSSAPGVVREITDSGLLDTVVQSLFQDDRGRIWLSTPRGGAYFENDRFTTVNGVPGGQVHSITQDSAGDIWFSYEKEGLLRLVRGRVAEWIPWGRLGHEASACASIADPSQGSLWLGFYDGGIAYIKDGQVRASYTAADGLGKGRVNDLQLDRDGALWAATEGGLSRIKDGHVTTLTSKNGLPCDTVNWAIEDDFHTFWMYSACGLVRIARTELDAWVTDPNRMIEPTVFDSSDGVRSQMGAGGYSPHVTKSTDGKLWFPAYYGVSVIDPNHLAVNKLPPPVHIEQISADHKTYWQNWGSEAQSHLRLPPLVRDLTIDYTALSLVVPEKVRFRYKLEGWDRDWQDAGTRRQAFYTNLAPRKYRFRVMACNNSGVWNEEGASLDFVIPPAWYQTNWFRALCVAAFLVLLWALYQLRLRQLARQFNMRLEERVGERTRIARDLHDTLLQSFHGILLYFQTGINQLPEHSAESRTTEARKTLEKAMHQASHAIVEGREAIQGLRSSVVETNDLSAAIRTLGEELAGGSNGAAFQVHVEGTPRDLHPILRDEVYRITGEGMRNAFHHADAKQIEVEIHYDERRVRVRVRDDGKGIDPKLLSDDGREGHFGLRGMRERAKLIGGKLTVWSEVDAGTELELSIPASRAYTAPTDGKRMRIAEKFRAKLSGQGTAKKP